MAKLTIWNKPNSTEVRIYIGLRYDRSAVQQGYGDADGAFITADEDGMAVIRYRRDITGRVGESAIAFFKVFKMEGCTFEEILNRVQNAVGPRGAKFSEKVYFDNLK